MTREEAQHRKMKLKFLDKAKIAVNFQIQGMALEKKDLILEENDKEFTQLLEKLQAIEVETMKLKNNKLGSTFYTFTPFVGLNRKQRRSYKRN